MKRYYKSIRFLLAIIFAAFCLQLSARNINVRGKVIQDGTNEPLYGVGIYNAANNKFIGATNDEGRYTVNVPDDATLVFKVMGSEEQTVDVNGRITIDVVLAPKAKTLDEVVVQAKAITNALVTEPTEIEVKGNYLFMNTHVKVPHKLFSSSMRMIIQPSMYNITTKRRVYMKPVVFDGHRYAITQERMYDWKPETDPLIPYQKIKKTGGRTDDIIPLKDSVYTRNPNHDFRLDIMTALETYNSIIYADTIQIARGTVNPLRFLSYSVKGSPVVDERFFPTPEMQLRDTKGDVRLTFPVGKSKLNMELGDNRAEMNRLLAGLKEIENNPDMAIKSFTISGTASPEGNYNSNLRLSKERMEAAMDVILQGLSPATRKSIDVKTEASVASWSDVVSLLKADGRNEEAEVVAGIVSKYPKNISRQSALIAALPSYGLIKDTYLPRLRNVQYEFVTSRYRYLTDDEIKQLYATNSKDMSRYEFWRLYTQAADTAERETIIRKALEVHPRFLVGATDLAAILLDRGKGDVNLIQPILEKAKGEVPDESRLNQGIAFLGDGQYTRADSILSLLPDKELFHKAKIYSAAQNGRYLDVMQEVSEDSPLNEVLLLMAIKANDEAWEKAKKLGNSAVEEYVKAAAANRVDQYLAAMNHMENALRLDPSLIEIAKVDADVVDLVSNEDDF